MRKLAILVSLCLCLTAAGTALAMSSSAYELPWQSLSAGGGNRESANYALKDAVGQSAIGMSQSLSYRLEAGFWPGFTFVAVTPLGDANGDGSINVLDMTRVARIILLLDMETPGADANEDGTINVLDMTKIARIILGLD